MEFASKVFHKAFILFYFVADNLQTEIAGMRTGEMAQWLIVTALPEDLGSAPHDRSYATVTTVSGDPTLSSDLNIIHTQCTDTNGLNTHTDKERIKIKNHLNK